MPTAPSTNSTMPPSPPYNARTLDRVILELKHYRTFTSPLPDSSNPYIKAMHTFQTFTNALIRALEAREPKVVSLAHAGVLQEMYAGFPYFFDLDRFAEWVKDGTLKHPLRRTAKQYQWLEIVALQEDKPSLSLEDKVAAAVAAVHDWKERAYAPVSLKQDADCLYFFLHKHGLTDIDAAATASQIGEDCPVCTNAFDQDWNKPQQAPCGHVLCTACFYKWLLQSTTGAYTCPMCRACVVCGLNNCPYHVLERDKASPLPITFVLDRVLPDKKGEALHGIAPEWYWVLREDTRGDRVTLAHIMAVLRGSGLQGRYQDPVHIRLSGDFEEIMNRVREAVAKAVEGSRHGPPDGILNANAFAC